MVLPGLIAYLILWLGVPTKDFDPDLRKTFYRDPDDKIAGGVAKGIANYLKADVDLVRFIFFVSICFGGFGFLIYIFLWIFTKEAENMGKKNEYVLFLEINYCLLYTSDAADE